MKLSVIIPAYNEEKRIGPTLEAVHSYLEKQSYEAEVIVVNDGSTDNTRGVLMSYAQIMPELIVINNPLNSGKGSVVRQGMLAAKGEYRLFMDADNSTTIDHVERLFPYLSRGYDIAISSRRVAGAELEQDQSKARLLLGSMFRFIVHSIVPLGIVDSQNGFKLFTRAATERIFPKQTIFHWAFDVEVLALAKLYGFRIKEVPVRWVNDENTHVTVRGMLRMLVEVVQVRLNLWVGKYSV